MHKKGNSHTQELSMKNKYYKVDWLLCIVTKMCYNFVPKSKGVKVYNETVSNYQFCCQIFQIKGVDYREPVVRVKKGGHARARWGVIITRR